MCYSYEVSIITFLIGTFFTLINLFYFNENTLYLIITLCWFFGGILMQLWETLLWKNYKCKLISKIAMVNNLLQPILWLFILLIPGYIKKQKININLIIIIMAFYIYYVSKYFKNDYGCIKTNTGINLKWWDDNIGCLIYFLVQMALFILILPKNIMKSQLAIFCLSLAIGNVYYFYNNKSKFSFNDFYKGKINGRLGSIWCWVAAFTPLINLIIFNMDNVLV